MATYQTITQAEATCQALGRGDLNRRLIKSYIDRGYVDGYKTGEGRTCAYMVNLDSLLAFQPPPVGRPRKQRLGD